MGRADDGRASCADCSADFWNAGVDCLKCLYSPNKLIDMNYPPVSALNSLSCSADNILSSVNGIAAEFRDLIDQVPDGEPYYNLIQRTPVSDEKRLRQLLTSCELGDKRPSQLLKHMKQLAGPYNLDEPLLKQMCFQCLLNNVRQILSLSKNSVTLKELADMADKMMEVYPDNHSSNSVKTAAQKDKDCTAMFQ
ncbi:unnamed protein product [Schistosoma mattheei]|uniref:Uncharacterized protein n=1 Tax=Schistosoma mattheei TaxID=31246 RepID=A0A183NI38_9TREM|nr:unnamed protein product [Schistosoma mattheei]